MTNQNFIGNSQVEVGSGKFFGSGFWGPTSVKQVRNGLHQKGVEKAVAIGNVAKMVGERKNRVHHSEPKSPE